MPRVCLFCGKSANSKEHAVPAWLASVVDGDGQMTHRRHREGIAWKTTGFDITVRQVCRGCNETWMSELETRAKPLVTDLVKGGRTASLSHSEQKLLSAWGWKTAAMLALAYPEPERFVSPQHYRSFYDNRKPPMGTTAWIAGLVPEVVGTGETQTAWTKPERLDFTSAATGELRAQGYRLSFSVGRLIFQSMWDPFSAGFRRPREYRDVWTRIHPISKGDWPPKRWIGQSEIEGVAGGRVFSGPQL